MSESMNKLKADKEIFLQRDELRDGAEVLKKITTLVNDIARDFNSLNGGDLSEVQVKLAGYKFYLSDHIADLMNKSEYLKAWIKEEKANRYHEAVSEITKTDGKVKNKEQIDSYFTSQLSEDIKDQIFYESEWQRYKLKSFAVDDILTSIVQRLASLKREEELARRIQ